MKDKTLSELLKRYQTPLYVYEKKRIEDSCNTLKEGIMENAELYYSIKANPLVGVARILQGKGCGAETASIGEIVIALKAGFPPERIIYTGPGKTYNDICMAVQKQIAVINLESLAEAKLINEAGKKYGKIIKVGIRINPMSDYSGAKIKMSGVASQFGINEEEAVSNFFKEIHQLRFLRIVGIQIYMGTQILSAQRIIYNTKFAIKKALDLSEGHRFDLEYLNVGGGFGIPYFEGETELNMQELKEGMKKLQEEYRRSLEHTKIIFESGRYLLADAGCFITQILYMKRSKGTEYIICDGGSNFHASSAFLGRFVRNNYPLHSIPDSYKKKKVNIVGPLCMPNDMLGQNVSVNSEVKEGDYIVIEKSGAYGLTYSPLLFLSHETPMELLADGEIITILRNRIKAEELLSGQDMRGC